MKQLYEPYYLWEDYINGMWRKICKSEEDKWLQIAIEFTGNTQAYGDAMLRIIKEWPVTCRHNLTDASLNHRAFIGHCAASLAHNIPEYITRSAWMRLTEKQRVDANKKADIAFKEWRRLNRHKTEKAKQLSLYEI